MGDDASKPGPNVSRPQIAGQAADLGLSEPDALKLAELQQGLVQAIDSPDTQAAMRATGAISTFLRDKVPPQRVDEAVRAAFAQYAAAQRGAAK